VLELSGGLIKRCDGRDAELRDWFHQASAALGQVARKAPGSLSGDSPATMKLARRPVFDVG
jgi:hypothetical protein